MCFFVLFLGRFFGRFFVEALFFEGRCRFFDDISPSRVMTASCILSILFLLVGGSSDSSAPLFWVLRVVHYIICVYVICTD